MLAHFIYNFSFDFTFYGIIKFMKSTLSQRTINRLTQYYTILRDLTKKEVQSITSSYISQLLKIDETQVRKDIKQINCKGKCKVGYSVFELKDKIESVLDYKIIKKALIIGAGNLGNALANYGKFSEFGLEITALFDINSDIIGQEINGIKIFDLKTIDEYIKKTNIKIAILTTPNKAAQEVCDYIISKGIKYIWNFAPTILNVPQDVKVWHENLVGSFIQFCAVEDIK